MDSFMNQDFIINEITLALFMAKGIKKTVDLHENRPNYGLAIHLDGDKYYTFDGNKKFRVQKNNIIFMPKGTTYTVDVQEHGECFAINFDIANTVLTEPFCFKTKNGSVFIESFKKAEHAWRTKSAGQFSKCMRELYNIIYNMKKEYNLSYVSSEKSKIISPAIEYIHANYTKENISIPHLAKLCSVSETYLRQIFLSTFGLSPVNYINDLKFSYVRELLKSNMYSVYDAMTMSGFEDAAYFSRAFKKHFGMSPSEYKKQKGNETKQ